jgi:hypothetical protein
VKGGGKKGSGAGEKYQGVIIKRQTERNIEQEEQAQVQ